jgi:hypothetical protein
MQKDIFLKSEGDAYYLRNHGLYNSKDYSKDRMVLLIKSILKKRKNKKIKILEIGCCAGHRLNYLVDNFSNIEAYGIDPSYKAIKSNKNRKIKLKIATADNILFNIRFDIVILGLCLYLCDDEDLFKITSEVDRVSKSFSYIIIEDFIKRKTLYNNYKHKKKIRSRYMNYTKMFTWHPKIRLKKKINYIYSKNKNSKNLISLALLEKKL